MIRNTFISFTYIINNKKSTKHSNSFILIDEKKFTFDDWFLLVQNKLQVNENYFTSSAAQIIYVISRVKNDAADYVSVYHTDNKVDYFKTF